GVWVIAVSLVGTERSLGVGGAFVIAVAMISAHDCVPPAGSGVAYWSPHFVHRSDMSNPPLDNGRICTSGILYPSGDGDAKSVGQTVQSSIASPGTLPKSRRFRVNTMRPRFNAIAAIRKSIVAIRTRFVVRSSKTAIA